MKFPTILHHHRHKLEMIPKCQNVNRRSDHGSLFYRTCCNVIGKAMKSLLPFGGARSIAPLQRPCDLLIALLWRHSKDQAYGVLCDKRV